MRLAFDAKRIFQNNTGLGNYSRTLVSSLATYFPEHDYFLYAPKHTSLFDTAAFPNMHVELPAGFPSTLLKSLWRSKWVKEDLCKNHIDIYHGLSHEIPFGIQRTNIKTVVTIHDLIFERYPEQFSKIDVRIYRKKFTNACHNADRIIAISEQTRRDIIDMYHIDEGKISVCYQSCNPAFATTVDDNLKTRIRKKYNLPKEFFLYVGSVIERKNLLNICKALLLASQDIRIPLIVIGSGGSYMEKVKNFVNDNNLNAQVTFLSETEEARTAEAFRSGKDFPAIYQSATALLYPSYFEGFGIPVLEALWSRLPVITSHVSCMPETGGDAALYIDPASPHEIADAMITICRNKSLAEDMKQKGWQHAQHFTQRKCAEDVMNVYLSL